MGEIGIIADCNTGDDRFVMLIEKTNLACGHIKITVKTKQGWFYPISFFF